MNFKRAAAAIVGWVILSESIFAGVANSGKIKELTIAEFNSNVLVGTADGKFCYYSKNDKGMDGLISLAFAGEKEVDLLCGDDKIVVNGVKVGRINRLTVSSDH